MRSHHRFTSSMVAVAGKSGAVGSQVCVLSSTGRKVDNLFGAVAEVVEENLVCMCSTAMRSASRRVHPPTTSASVCNDVVIKQGSTSIVLHPHLLPNADHSGDEANRGHGTL